MALRRRMRLLTTSPRRTLVAITLVAVAYSYPRAGRAPAVPHAGPDGRERAAAPRQAIQIARSGDAFLHIPLYLALDGGHFAGLGLAVQLESSASDEAAWAAVQDGRAGFAVADPGSVALFAARGQPGRIIASLASAVPYWGVTLDPTLDVQHPMDLAGRTVATTPAPTSAHVLQREMFLRGGLRPRIRDGAAAALLGMLRSGTADIALMSEPAVSQAVTSGARVIYSLAHLFGRFSASALAAAPALLEAQPALAERVVCALQRAVDFARRDPRRAAALLAPRFPGTAPAVLEMALRRQLDTEVLPRDLAVEPRAWQRAMAVRRRAGDLTSMVPAGELLDERFAARAARDCRLPPAAAPAPARPEARPEMQHGKGR
jgi:NitT/TauT family transport system substrate-binding protein